MKIGVIGLGSVGSTLTYNLIVNQLADEIFLYDINENWLIAQKLDLEQGAALNTKQPKLIKASLDMLYTCDIVVNTASAKIQNPDRLSELKTSRAIVEQVFAKFKNFPGIIINVSNPCDIITKLIKDVTGLPANRVIGSGTLLDTIRLKMTFANHYDLNPEIIKTLVIGEHGTSQVLVYSNCYINDFPYQDYVIKNNLAFQEDLFANEVKAAGATIFNTKNRTEYGIASCVGYIIKQIVNDTGAILPLSTSYIYEGKEIYISKLVVINRNGYQNDIPMTLTTAEEEGFTASCQKISNILYLN